MNISEIGELYQIPKVGFSENEIIRAEQNIGVLSAIKVVNL